MTLCRRNSHRSAFVLASLVSKTANFHSSSLLQKIRKFTRCRVFLMSVALYAVLSLFSNGQQATAQCTNTTLFPATAVNAGTGALVTISNASKEQHYSRINNIVNGATYQFTISRPNSWITVRSGSSSGTVLAFGQTPVSVTVTSTSDLYVHWNSNNSCGTNNGNRTTTVQRMAPTITSLGTTGGCVGSTITINGTNLSSASSVTIGGTAVSSILTNTATQITATVASGTTGTVAVTTAGGTATSSSTFTVYNLPQSSNFTGNTICNGNTGQLTLTTSSGTGPFTVVYNDGTANRTASAVSSGTAFNVFTNPNSTTNYSLVSITSADGCVRNSSFTDASATITVNPIPQNKTLTAASSIICPGTSTTIEVASSQTGVTYQLRNNSDNSNVGAAVAGTGANINLSTGTLSATTTFNVYATITATGCSRQVGTLVTITMDNVAPVITCPANQSINLGSACTAVMPDYRSLAVVSDNCTASGSITITQSPAAGTVISATGTQVVTLTATDANGNSSNCVFNLTKQDVTAPVIACPSNITVNAAAGACGATVTYSISATDNCSGPTNCAPSSITGYTLIGTLNGHTYFRSTASTNWATANSNAIALGAHLLTITSATENVYFAGLGQHWAGMTDQTTEGTWEWINGETSSYTNWNAGEPNNNGGNEDHMMINWAGTNAWNDYYGTNTLPYIIEFDCDDITMTLTSGYASGSEFPVGTTTVSYTATDLDGNSSNCSFTVTVNDITAPVISCPANINVTTAAGACTAVVNYTTPTVTDNCGGCSSIPAISGYTSLGIYNGSIYYISNSTANGPAAFTAAAAVGAQVATMNSATENTFVRNAANVAGYSAVSYLIGLTDAVTEGTFLGGSGETATYFNWYSGEPNNSGNEDYVQVYNTGYWNDVSSGFASNYIIKVACITPSRTAGLASGSSFPVGTTTISYVATDASGNSANCSFTVTVAMNAASTGKTVTAASGTICSGSSTNINVAASETTISYQLRNNATNANIGSPVTGTGGTISLPTGALTATTTFNIIATNTSTGCTFQLTNTATVTVNARPVVSITGSSAICAGATTTLSPATGGTWASSDNTVATVTNAGVVTGVSAGSATFTFTQTSTGCANTTAAVTINALPADKTVTAVSGTVCPASSTSIEVSSSQTGVNYQLRNNATNATIGSPVAGTGGTISLATGALSATTSFNILATNASTSCSRQLTTVVTVTVDNVPPVITCPANQTINLGASCTATMTDYRLLATVSDNCTATGSIVITQSPAVGATLSNAGVEVVTITATDANGNSSNCTFNLTKQDVTAPVISCPADITVNTTTGLCGAVVTYTVSATDNCSGSTLCAPSSIPGYTLVGTYNGHTYFRSTTNANWATANSNASALGAHLLTVSSSGENALFAGLGQHWTGFTDQTTEGTWAWINGEAVVYTSWSSGEPNNSGGNEDYMALNWSGTNWNDLNGANSLPYVIEFDCENISMTLNSGYASGSTFPVGTTVVSYTATDQAGNTSNCSFNVTVNDATAPAIACPANISVTTAASTCTATVTYATPVATDNCGTCTSAPAISGFTSLGVYNGAAYYISNSGTTAPAAITAAATYRGQVATITSAAENTFVRNAANSAGFTGSYIIGINDAGTEGVFTGGSGELISYTNWSSGEPNNSGGNEDYVQVTNTGVWNDVGSTYSSNYILKVGCVTPVRTAGLASGSAFPIGVSTISYTATDAAGNTSNCSFTITVSMNATSIGKTVTAASSAICTGSSTNINIASSENGIIYQLRNNATNAAIGSPVTGNGGTISLPTGTLTTTTTFNILATNSGNGCSYQLTNTRTVTVNALPVVSITGSTTICVASTTSLSPTSGGTWASSNNAFATVTNAGVVTGVGAGAVTFTFTQTSTGCSSTTSAVTVNAQPGNRTVSASSTTVCAGTAVNIQVATSQSGISYQLRNNSTNANIGSAVAGTGGTINLSTGVLSSTTTFNVLATNVSTGCTLQMSVTPTVTVNPTGQWIGGTTGNWNVSGNWCGGIPGTSTNVIIPAGVTVNIQSANATANSVTINGTGSLVMTGAYNLSITAGGTFTNNGTFNASASTGRVAFLGSGTVSGTTTFKNVDTYGALNFGTASTISGTFTIQTGGSVTANSPTYTCPSATLKYNTGSTFIRGLEWTTNSSGAGYPANVVIDNNTEINFPVSGQGYVCNDLQIQNGSALKQDYSGGSAVLRVGRNITINGTLSLGGSDGGDIYVGGSWTRSTSGVFNHNDRKVTFDGPANFSGNGTAMSTITAPASAAKNNEGGFGGENFAHLWINKSGTADSVVLQSNITVNRELGLTRGTFSLGNNDVTIVSNETRTADVAPITNTANVSIRYAGTGKFVVQRFIHNPTGTRSWRLLTAPLQSATAPSINEAYQESVVNPDKTNPNASGGIYNPWPGYGTHISGPGGTYNFANGFDHGSNLASILLANAGVTTWSSPASTKSVKVTDQPGWMMFIRGDRGFVIGGPYEPSQNTTLQPKGRINTGNVSVAVSAGKQVVGNPYASAISLLDVDVAGTAGKNATYYMWDPKMYTSYSQPGKWVTFTGVGTSFVQTSSQSAYTSDGKIESGMAFVMDVPAAGNIVFHESDKLPLNSSLEGNTSGAMMRPVERLTIPMLRTDLFVNNGNRYTLTDAVLNIFDASFDNAVSAEDAKKFINFNTKESFSINRDNNKLAIEKRRDIAAADTIFFAMAKMNELPYQIRFTATDFAPGMQAWLEDSYANIKQPVSTDGATLYNFNITADSLSKVADRFKVVFKQNWVVLPVNFTNVKAWMQDKQVVVSWSVSSEINVKQYEVERSSTGNSFSTIASAVATGSSIYQIADAAPLNGFNYYRIRSIDKDGKVHYSSIVKVNMQADAPSVQLYTNPVTDGIIKLQATNLPKGIYKVRLLNATGQLTAQLQFNHAGGSVVQSLPIKQLPAKGVYTVEISKSGFETTSLQLIIK